jgi:hypothetical protein
MKLKGINTLTLLKAFLVFLFFCFFSLLGSGSFVAFKRLVYCYPRICSFLFLYGTMIYEGFFLVERQKYLWKEKRWTVLVNSSSSHILALLLPLVVCTCMHYGNIGILCSKSRHSGTVVSFADDVLECTCIVRFSISISSTDEYLTCSSTCRRSDAN